MSAYEQAVRNARHQIEETFFKVCDMVFSPFAGWSDLQKLVTILGLLAFLAYVAARPPRVKRKYEEDRTDHGFVLLTMLIVGGFSAGLVYYPI